MNHYTLFVGDLSIFSTEDDLQDLFAPFGDLIEAKVIRCEETKKNLSYGFVKFGSYEAAINAMSQVNGHVLGGRPLRIGWASRKNRSSDSSTAHDDDQSAGLLAPSLNGSGEYFEHYSSPWLHPEHIDRASIHIIYHSNQIDNPVTEETFRRAFSDFGYVLDATIKKFEINKEQKWQKGYGFVHFSADPRGTNAAVQAANSMNGRNVDGVTFKCSLSHRLRNMLTNDCQPPSNINITSGKIGAGIASSLRSNSFDGSYPGFTSMSSAPAPFLFGYGAGIALNAPYAGFPPGAITYGGIAMQNGPFNPPLNNISFHHLAPQYQAPYYSSDYAGVNISRAQSQDSYFNAGMPPIHNSLMIPGGMNGMPLNMYHYQQQQCWLEMLCSQALLQQAQGQVPNNASGIAELSADQCPPFKSNMERNAMPPITTQIKESSMMNSYCSPPVTTATAVTNQSFDTSTTKESAASATNEDGLTMISCDTHQSISDQQELEDTFSSCAENITPTHAKEPKIFRTENNGQHICNKSGRNVGTVEDASNVSHETSTNREDDGVGVDSANHNTSQYHTADTVQKLSDNQITQQNAQDYCASVTGSVETGMTTVDTARTKNYKDLRHEKSHVGVVPEKSQSRRSSLSELSYGVGSCCSLDSYNSDEGVNEMHYLSNRRAAIPDHEQEQHRLAQMMMPLHDNSTAHYHYSSTQSCGYDYPSVDKNIKVDSSDCAHNANSRQTGLPPQHPIGAKVKHKLGHQNIGNDKICVPQAANEHCSTDSYSPL